MQTKRQLIYDDLCTIGILGLVLFDDHAHMGKFWIGLLEYFFVKQSYSHWEYYKMNHRLF
jgi:hypothetical protein